MSPLADIYSDRQWQWIGKRWVEGFAIDTLSDWLGISPAIVRAAIARTGAVKTQRNLPGHWACREISELDDMKSEFNELWRQNNAD